MTESSQITKKTGGGIIITTPVKFVCLVCDSKFFDVCASRESALRLHQIFIDTLSVDCPAADPTSTLRFCPTCAHKLNELDCLLTKLDTLQLRIQSIKEFLFATVANTSLQLKHGASLQTNESDPQKSLLVNVREQVVQSWTSISKGGGNSEGEANRNRDKDAGSKEQQQRQDVNNKANSPPRPDFECRGQNGLEIFDRLEEQESELDNDSADYPPTPIQMPYVSIITDTDASSSSTGAEIKIDPDSWGMMDTEAYQNSNSGSTDGCFIEEVGRPMGRKTNVASLVPSQPVTIDSNNGVESMFYDESESDSSTYVFAPNTLSSKGGHNASGAATASQQSFTKPVRRNIPAVSAPATTIKALKTPRPYLPSILRSPARAFLKERSIEIEMCTICFKYIASGVKHLCGEKSTTTMYQCAYCNAVFHSERVLNEHVRRHIPIFNNEEEEKKSKPVHICKICRQHFPSSNKLAAHVKNDHVTGNGPSSDVIKCQLCPKTFRDISLFRIHMIAHSKNHCSRLNRNIKQDSKVFPEHFLTEVKKIIERQHVSPMK